MVGTNLYDRDTKTENRQKFKFVFLISATLGSSNKFLEKISHPELATLLKLFSVSFNFIHSLHTSRSLSFI